MKAVIMAGGKGTRLKPLTCNKPKPMVPIVNRPMLEHIINLLRKHHITEVLVTSCYLPEQISEYFGDGEGFGVKTHYLIEETPLGTAGSVKNAEKFLDETFLVLSGDALTDIDLGAALQFHKARQATATLVLTKVDNPLEYGVVITEQDGRIKKFLEKPGWGEVFSDTVNTGIYILEPKVFSYYERDREYDFSKNLFPQLLEKDEPLFGYVASGYWSDIGNLDQYRQAHYDVLRGKVELEIPGHQVRPGIWIGEQVVIDPQAYLEPPLFLGNFTRIAAQTRIEQFSIIGEYGQVQEGSSIKRGILWNHCYVGANSEIRAATLCDQVQLQGKNTVYEGAVLGEKVRLGRKAVLKPGVRIWPNKEIDSGAVLNDSLIWANKGAKSLFGNSGISGIVNRDLTPELAAKLGAIFGAHLKPGSQVVVSCDDFRAARVLKRALVSGLLASGVGVYDLGTMITPLTRSALVSLNAKGGVHLRIDNNNAEALLLQFFDNSGMVIDKATERALENAFFSEDFPRAPANALGELAFVPKLVEPYLNNLLDPAAKDLIIQASFKIGAIYDQGFLGLILSSLFEMLGCLVLTPEETGTTQANRPRTLPELLEAIDQLKETIQINRADLGVIVDNNAERLLLIDENGKLVKEEELQAIISLLVLKGNPETTVPIPVTAPEYLEQLAQKYHGKVIRTKTNPRSLMERNVQEKLFPNGNNQAAFQPQYDALFSFVKVLELLAREKLTLAQARAELPEIERHYREIDCPWEAKGRIMRSLFEENKERRLETVDGLKVYHDQGWALVLPDAEEPIFKIYAEAKSVEEADGLANLYSSRIQELQE